MRIGLSLTLLAEMVGLLPHLGVFFTKGGYIQAPLADIFARNPIETIFPAMSRLRGLIGTVASPWLCLAVAVQLASLLALLVGCWTRWAAAFALAAHIFLKWLGSTSAYGAGEFQQMLLFYCVVMPVGGCFSMDAGAGRPREPGLRSCAAIGSALLRAHLAVVYLASGLEKAQGQQWFNGEAIWRAGMRPDNLLTLDLLAHWPAVAVLGGWGVLLLEAGFPILILSRRSRPWVVWGVVSMHLGIAAVLGLWAFSATLLLFNLGAFPGVLAAPLLEAGRKLGRGAMACSGMAATTIRIAWPRRREGLKLDPL